jgi:hypothetical protein
MKTPIFKILVLSLFVAVAACSGKKEAHDYAAVADEDSWPEMDEFHMLMAESFHPFKDSANLEPARANASEMARVAEKWATAALPKKVDTENVKNMLQQLKAATATFAQSVTASDSLALGESLTKLHDDFHRIQEAWYGGGEDHHDHHKH